MDLRNQFSAAMWAAIEVSMELGYTPTRFMQMLEKEHPVEVAKRLAVSGEFQLGIRELTKLRRQDLTIEDIMLQERFAELFTEEERGAAAWRLKEVKRHL